MNRDELRRALAALERGDWRGAHRIVQRDERSPLACWAHGIVHLVEGDRSNARHWYRAAGRPCPRASSAQEEIRRLAAALAE